MQTILFCLLAYISGSIPTGKIVGHLHGVDIQKKGSGNIGFANVLRVLGWRSAMVVLLVDAAKSYLPVILAAHYLPDGLAYIVGLSAILGNVFSVWLKFKGGKGIATGFGVVLALEPVLALAGLIVYLLVFALRRKSAVASLAAVWFMPLLALFVVPEAAWFYVGLALFATWTHRTNLRQLARRGVSNHGG